MATAEVLETVEVAREYLDGGYRAADDTSLALTFATVIMQLTTACTIGMPCEKHSGAVHGQEAEELRAGVERILTDVAVVEDADAPAMLADVKMTLESLLDDVDARDSLVYCVKREARELTTGAKLRKVRELATGAKPRKVCR